MLSSKAERTRPDSTATWMGWNPESVARLLEADPEPRRIGANLAGILAERLLFEPKVEYSFYLYVHSESHDRYDLAGAWGAPQVGPRSWGSDIRVESVPLSVEDGAAALQGDDRSREFFLPLETEDGVLGFGIFRVGREVDLPEVPEVDLGFLGRIGGTAISQLQEQRRSDFAQNALASSTRYLERILSMTGDGMLLLDPECRILVSNDAVERLLGRMPIDLNGELLQDVLPNEAGVSLLTGAHLAASQDVPVTRTLTLSGNGAGRVARTVEASFERVQVDLEGAPGVLICLRDLEHIAREEWFAKNEKQQGQVLASINRGLLRPVAALRGYLWLLRDELSVKGRTGGLLRTLDLQAEWLQSQLEALAMMDEFRTGQTRWRDRPVSPEVLFDRATSRIKSRLESRGIVVKQQLARDLPWVRVDVEKWVVVLAFLMERTSQHLEGPGEILVDERQRSEGVPRIQLRIRGIPRERTDLPTRKESTPYDSGIPQQEFAYGMPLARSVVHHYGGTLLWDCPVDAAPTVHLTLPYEDEGALTPESLA